jgi:transcription initiation factor TFIID TATA-box-binding protein
MISINNVVMTGWFDSHIDRRALANLSHGKFAEATFPATVTKMRSPATTNCCFQSGKNVNTGAKTAHEALLSLYLIQKTLVMRGGLQVRLRNMTVENVATSTNVGYKIDIKAFHAAHEAETELHDLFTGMPWRTRLEDDTKITFVVFTGGKVLPVGVKNFNVINMIRKKLEYFKPFELGKQDIPDWRRKNYKEETLIQQTTRLPIDTTRYSTNDKGEVLTEASSLAPTALMTKKRKRGSIKSQAVKEKKAY